ncbi:MAG: hypothetical protein KDE33_26970 [Bacteroidetes bacterium]|nr:hypothetical protein [Bacteroidota bacterium]MCB9227146.1 hypothetical protein [Chitinophagales bacterium]
MKKIILVPFFMFFVLLSIAQTAADNSAAETVIKMYQDCKCKEIVVIGDDFDKPYDSKWLNFIRAEDGFLVFQKEDLIHRWNVSNILFIEQEKFVMKIFIKK